MEWNGCDRTCEEIIFEAAAKTLQCPRIQVGGNFHEIDRNAALIFIDFVEMQLIGLLVAFRSLRT